jgi:hypothetical protein
MAADGNLPMEPEFDGSSIHSNDDALISENNGADLQLQLIKKVLQGLLLAADPPLILSSNSVGRATLWN